jgi:segregation and condensation protein A
MATAASYTIKLPAFEGPFDLLLFFIERDELDIYNIPIAEVTKDFLAYIRQMEAMNVDLASEFILVAATLMRIKAKMLLPRKPIDDEGNEIDPREELVQKLLEYKKYKSILDEMRAMEDDRSMRELRGGTARDLREIATKALVDVEMESLTLFKLLRVFENVLRRFEDNTKEAMVHTIINYSHTIAGQQEYLFLTLKKGEKSDFKAIFGTCVDRIHAIITFLAMLELINGGEVIVLQGEGLNNFWLELA